VRLAVEDAMALLEEDAAGDGLVEDLGERELGLQNGDVVAVARPAVGGRLRARPGLPSGAHERRIS
jgi:hypothetical protein